MSGRRERVQPSDTIEPIEELKGVVGVATKRASIRDVATLAGVSVTTVSHVLNGVEQARVAEQTKIRVREAAEQLSYRPSRMARGLRTQKTKTLGLISDNIATTPYAVDMLLGAQEAALKRGWTLLLLNTGSVPEVERRAIRELTDHQAEGVIFASMYHRIVTVPAELRGIPTVLLDAECDDAHIPAVVPNDYDGARKAVDYLLSYGHQRIGFVNNIDDIPATHERERAYLDALNAAGIAVDAGLITAEKPETAGGYRAVMGLLSRHDASTRPSAFFCFNDRMAMGAYRVAAELGLRIPTDLSIVGFDNQTVIAEGLHPQLSTVGLPHYDMGVWSVDTIVDRIENPGRRRRARFPLRMDCPLIRRASVSAPLR
jgi:LacI family transcriptional regulator